MKKLAASSIFILLFVCSFPAISSADQNAEIKAGVSVADGSFEGHSFTIKSAEIVLEKPLWRELGFGIGARKEGRWAYDGYYLSLYARYKRPFLGPWYLHTSGGIDYGTPNKAYDRYEDSFDGNGNFEHYKWTYIVQDTKFLFAQFDAENFASVQPFATLSLGTELVGPFSLEAGMKTSFITFGVKEGRAYQGSVVAVRDEKKVTIVPSVLVRLVFSF